MKYHFILYCWQQSIASAIYHPSHSLDIEILLNKDDWWKAALWGLLLGDIIFSLMLLSPCFSTTSLDCLLLILVVLRRVSGRPGAADHKIIVVIRQSLFVESRAVEALALVQARGCAAKTGARGRCWWIGDQNLMRLLLRLSRRTYCYKHKRPARARLADIYWKASRMCCLLGGKFLKL